MWSSVELLNASYFSVIPLTVDSGIKVEKKFCKLICCSGGILSKEHVQIRALLNDPIIPNCL